MTKYPDISYNDYLPENKDSCPEKALLAGILHRAILDYAFPTRELKIHERHELYHWFYDDEGDYKPYGSFGYICDMLDIDKKRVHRLLESLTQEHVDDYMVLFLRFRAHVKKRIRRKLKRLGYL